MQAQSPGETVRLYGVFDLSDQADPGLLWPRFFLSFFLIKAPLFSPSKKKKNRAKEKRINTNGAGSKGLQRQGNYPAITAAFRS